MGRWLGHGRVAKLRSARGQRAVAFAWFRHTRVVWLCWRAQVRQRRRVRSWGGPIASARQARTRASLAHALVLWAHVVTKRGRALAHAAYHVHRALHATIHAWRPLAVAWRVAIRLTTRRHRHSLGVAWKGILRWRALTQRSTDREALSARRGEASCLSHALRRWRQVAMQHRRIVIAIARGRIGHWALSRARHAWRSRHRRALAARTAAVRAVHSGLARAITTWQAACATSCAARATLVRGVVRWQRDSLVWGVRLWAVHQQRVARARSLMRRRRLGVQLAAVAAWVSAASASAQACRCRVRSFQLWRGNGLALGLRQWCGQHLQRSALARGVSHWSARSLSAAYATWASNSLLVDDTLRAAHRWAARACAVAWLQWRQAAATFGCARAMLMRWVCFEKASALREWREACRQIATRRHTARKAVRALASRALAAGLQRWRAACGTQMERTFWLQCDILRCTRRSLSRSLAAWAIVVAKDRSLQYTTQQAVQKLRLVVMAVAFDGLCEAHADGLRLLVHARKLSPMLLTRSSLQAWRARASALMRLATLANSQLPSISRHARARIQFWRERAMKLDMWLSAMRCAAQLASRQHIRIAVRRWRERHRRALAARTAAVRAVHSGLARAITTWQAACATSCAARATLVRGVVRWQRDSLVWGVRLWAVHQQRVARARSLMRRRRLGVQLAAVAAWVSAASASAQACRCRVRSFQLWRGNGLALGLRQWCGQHLQRSALARGVSHWSARSLSAAYATWAAVDPVRSSWRYLAFWRSRHIGEAWLQWRHMASERPMHARACALSVWAARALRASWQFWSVEARRVERIRRLAYHALLTRSVASWAFATKVRRHRSQRMRDLACCFFPRSFRSAWARWRSLSPGSSARRRRSKCSHRIGYLRRCTAAIWAWRESVAASRRAVRELAMLTDLNKRVAEEVCASRKLLHYWELNKWNETGASPAPSPNNYEFPPSPPYEHTDCDGMAPSPSRFASTTLTRLASPTCAHTKHSRGTRHALSHSPGLSPRLSSRPSPHPSPRPSARAAPQPSLASETPPSLSPAASPHSTRGAASNGRPAVAGGRSTVLTDMPPGGIRTPMELMAGGEHQVRTCTANTPWSVYREVDLGALRFM